MGAYQFGMARLCDLGYTERNPSGAGFVWKAGYSLEKFLNDPVLQDKIFHAHVVDHIRTIKGKFGGYLTDDVKVAGILITLSGLVAGAHLGGIGGVSKFLREGHGPADATGTKVEHYIERFGGYDLSKLT